MGATILRGGRLSSRPFYTTVLLLSVLTAYSFLSHSRYVRSDDSSGTTAAAIFKRSDSEKPECSEVHNAEDQCAFVKQYCADENAGLIPYLTLYYCNLHHAQAISFIILVSWLGMLFTTIGIAASDFFSINLSTIATILGLSESLAGVTFLAFGNGSPDVFSTFAAMGSNSASMAYGELIGAASFITGVVAGSMALVREFKVDKKTYARDICFFIVAVGFTMVFLIDGHLHLWECCIMVGYYALYVITVVCWHWYTTRRRSRLRREGEARSHVYGVAGHLGEELAGEPYRDDPDDIDAVQESSRNDIAATDLLSIEHGSRHETDGRTTDLERGRGSGSNTGNDDDDDNDDEHNKLVAAEVASNMRVLRGRGRRSTITPIRPSLVGALEFRSALAHLQRESNHQLSHITGRSYSENLLPEGARLRRGTSAGFATTDSGHLTATRADGTGRERSHSSGSMPHLSMPHLNDGGRNRAGSNLSLPQPLIPASAQSMSPAPSYTVGGNLAPPPMMLPAPAAEQIEERAEANEFEPALQLEIPTRRSSYSDHSPASCTPFPNYTDSPMIMTPVIQPERSEYLTQLPVPGGLSRSESQFADLHIPTEQPKPVRWWPYSILPAPHVLLATLFPTMQGWKDKTYWDKFVSVISVPSIFLLVITLPVVESETTEGASLTDAALDLPEPHLNRPAVSVEPAAMEHESEWQRYQRYNLSRTNSYRSLPEAHSRSGHEDAHDPAGPANGHEIPAPPAVIVKPASDQPSTEGTEEPLGWNRWLVFLQVFTGPLFAVLVLWANMSEDWERPGKALVMMVLWTLLGSLVTLLALMVFTSEQKRPKYHWLLCFMGFVISIAWISTIAGEVVGVLKTFGVVLGISEALLGLTIFAAGNSIGDLIADITVARLGYPVMALAACFGGPMLNILLGIGIGGALVMVQKANHHHRKHPDRPLEYKPFEAQVSGSLVISAITLVLTLLVLLVAVPMNKWVLSRKIGYTVIAMWAVSTVVNVIVEATGAWGEIGESRA